MSRRSLSSPPGRPSSAGPRASHKTQQGAVGSHSLQWQHPFVDVFRVFQVPDFEIADKLGDVTSVLDPEIGKTCFRVLGAVAASNRIQIPRSATVARVAGGSKAANRYSLGLTGTYAYFQLKQIGNKYTTFHVDAITTDGMTYRFSFSTMFRSLKLTGYVAQIPIRLRDRWTVFCINLPCLLEHVTGGSVPASKYQCIKGIQLCANMSVRNVFTSDTKYTPETFPREMAFPLPGKVRWEDRYDLLWAPNETVSAPAPPTAVPKPAFRHKGLKLSKKQQESLRAQAEAAARDAVLHTPEAKPKETPSTSRPAVDTTFTAAAIFTPNGSNENANPDLAVDVCVTPSQSRSRRLSDEMKSVSKARSPLAQGHQRSRRSPSVGSLSSLHRRSLSDHEADFGTELDQLEEPRQPLGIHSGPSHPVRPVALQSPPRSSSAVELRVPRGGTPQPKLLQEARERHERSAWVSDEAEAALGHLGPTGLSRGLQSGDVSFTGLSTLSSAARTSHELEDALQRNGIEVLQEARNILRRAGVPSSPSQRHGNDRAFTLGVTSTVPAGVAAAASTAVLPSFVRSVADAAVDQAAVLQPDPILRLAQVIGVSGTNAGSMLWSANGEEVIFPCANVVVVLNVAEDDSPASSNNTGLVSVNSSAPGPMSDMESLPSGVKLSKPRSQRHFRGHTADVSTLALTNRGDILVTAQSSNPPSIRVWDFATATCLAVLSCPTVDIGSISFSRDDRHMSTYGHDSHTRVVMSIWDVSRIRDGRHSIIARQVSDFPITKLRFSPYEDLKLVSCGRENIRFWRVKSGHLPGCPIVLNQYARGCDFTDVGFESAYGPASTDIRTQRRVYVSSSTGKLLQVNYSTRELECVFQLHDGPITSLSINEGFCVTGSQDKYLRVWPLDFSDFFIEAQHEDAVSSCVVSPDGIKVAIGTRNGSVGVLDVSTHSYDTLLRSHQRDVVALACRPTRDAAMLEEEIVTTSTDGTIRVWSSLNLAQLYEFASPKEIATCVTFHPMDNVIVCGFDNGFVRVFGIPTRSMLEEYQQHKGQVKAVKFSTDGSLLFSVATDGVVCVYDVTQGYTPVKLISTDLPEEAEESVVALAVCDDGVTLAVAVSPRPRRDPTPSDPFFFRAVGAGDASDRLDAFCPIVLLLDVRTLRSVGKFMLPQPVRKPKRDTLGLLPAALSLPVSSTGLVATIKGPGIRSDGTMKPKSGLHSEPAPEREYRGLSDVGSRVAEEYLVAITEVAFSADGRHVVCGTTDGRFVRWEVASGEVVKDIRGVHRGAVTALAVSPNGQYLVTGGTDNSVKVWDLFMRGPPPPLFQAFVGHTGPVTSLAFLPDGRRVVSASTGGAFFVWSFMGDATPRKFEFLDRVRTITHETLSFTDSAKDEDHGMASEPSQQQEDSGHSVGSGDDVEGTRWASAIRSVANASGVDPSLVAVRDALSVASTATSSQELVALHRSRSRPQLVTPEEHHQLEEIHGGDSDEQAGMHTTPNSEDWGGSAGDEFANAPGNDADYGVETDDQPQSGDDEGEATEDNLSANSDDGALNTEALRLERVRTIGVEGRLPDGIFWSTSSSVMGYACGNTVILESLATKAQTVLEGLTAPVSCLAIAPSGTTVVAGSAVASQDASAPTIVLWDYHTEGKYWFEKATFSFERGAQLPVSCLAFDRTGRYFVAVGVNGSNGLRVTTSVWDTFVESRLPLVSRQVVLTVHSLESSSRGIIGVRWESETRFFAYGACGLLEFEVTGLHGFVSVSSDRSSTPVTPVIRYRTILRPEDVAASTGPAAELTCGCFLEVPSRDGAKHVHPSSTPSFVAGDSTGGLWIVKKELISDAHLISRVAVPGLAEGGVVTSVVWREAAVVVGTSSGKLLALDVNGGAPAVRGTLEVSDAVSGMCWDGSAMDGIALTVDGSIWYTRWGVQPCALMAAHANPVVGMCSVGPSAVVTASRALASCGRVLEGSEWEQVLSLTSPESPTPLSPTVIAVTHSDDPLIVIGFNDGSIAAYRSSSSAAFFQTRPHVLDVSALCVVEDSGDVIAITGDSGGRLCVTDVQAHSQCVSERMDKLADGNAAAVARAHKYHPIVALESSRHDRNRFLAVSANGRVSVWSREAALGLKPLRCLLLNYNVDTPNSTWDCLVPVGAASESVATACFSPAQASVVACAVATPRPSVIFYDIEGRTVLRSVTMDAAVTRLTPLWLAGLGDVDLSFVAATTHSGSIALLSAHEDALGSVSAVIPPFFGIAASSNSFICTSHDGKAPVANIVTSQGSCLHVWSVDA